MMRVLIGCEFSGIIREAFKRLGHDAWSCDIIDTEIPSTQHIIADLNDVLYNSRKLTAYPKWIQYCKWDLLIAHPPCTYLTNASTRWLYYPDTFNKIPERWENMRLGAEFFMNCYNAPIPRVCIENPIMHKHAKRIGNIPEYTQLIKPWQFGHGEIKSTALWLKGLPPLKSTLIVRGREANVHRAQPGTERWKIRSRTLLGIAEAMAIQWGSLNSINKPKESIMSRILSIMHLKNKDKKVIRFECGHLIVLTEYQENKEYKCLTCKE
jgi:hypothetical protein